MAQIDGDLPDTPGEGEQKVCRLGRRAPVGHDVGHVRRPHGRVEMEGREPVGPPGRDGKHRGEQRRRVRREDCPRRAQLVELSQDAPLECWVLGHRLAHQVDLGSRDCRIGTRCDRHKCALVPLRVNEARRPKIVGEGADAVRRRLQGGRLDVVEHDLVAVGRALQPDLLAHCAAPDDENAAHFVDVHGFTSRPIGPVEGRPLTVRRWHAECLAMPGALVYGGRRGAPGVKGNLPAPVLDPDAPVCRDVGSAALGCRPVRPPSVRIPTIL